jgi:hypothetical protein
MRAPPAPPTFSITSISLAVYGLEALTLACALGMREAAINSMARVIFFVASTLDPASGVAEAGSCHGRYSFAVACARTST